MGGRYGAESSISNSCYNAAFGSRVGFLLPEWVVNPKEFLILPDEKKATPKRRYPALYEKIIPLALGLILLAIVVLLVVIVVVFAGAR